MSPLPLGSERKHASKVTTSGNGNRVWVVIRLHGAVLIADGAVAFVQFGGTGRESDLDAAAVECRLEGVSDVLDMVTCRFCIFLGYFTYQR